MSYEASDCCYAHLLFPFCVNNSNWGNDTHTDSHEMKEVNLLQERFHIDKDYCGFQPSLNNATYNYLDSNFHPAL